MPKRESKRATQAVGVARARRDQHSAPAAAKLSPQKLVADSSDDDADAQDDMDQEMEDAEDTDEGDEDADLAAGPSASHLQPKHAAASLAAMLPEDLDGALLRRTWAQLPLKHRRHKEALLQRYRAEFWTWRFQLRQRFSLLLYGAGSKRALLETFAAEALTDGGVLAIYGHQAGVTSKAVLAAVANALAHASSRTASHREMLVSIQAQPPQRRLYVLLHNIDGPGLRSEEEQLWLARLAQCPAVHLAATVDHANAALLWDRRLSTLFRWAWHHTTTYAPYEAETADQPPLLTSGLRAGGGGVGAATVLHSLVPSARSVFVALARRQLSGTAGACAGTSFAQLYRVCREKFIITSEGALRSHLAEFRDHALLRVRPGPDGGDVMRVPMEDAALQRLVEELEGQAGQAGVHGT